MTHADETAGPATPSRRGCPVCGSPAPRTWQEIISRELAVAWELSPEYVRWFNQREGWKCPGCGVSWRCQTLARALLSALARITGAEFPTLPAALAAPAVARLRVAEINAAGSLHPHLAAWPALAYSEFGSTRLPSENLERLSYAAASFDLVITSEVLEHVDDLATALREVRRVLKPGGAHVFTTPVVWDRPSRRRAVRQDGQRVHLLPPCYHGTAGNAQEDHLVVHEFGGDFPGLVAAAGFAVETVRDEDNPAAAAFIAWRG